MSSPLEIIAVLLAFFAVVLQWREHPATWWLVLISSILYIEVFRGAGLIWDATLQFFFIALAVRGIFSWRFGLGKENALELSMRPKIFHLRAFAISAAASVALGLVSIELRSIPSLVALCDGSLFVFSLLAVWLTERKIIECWVYWIGIDILAAGLYLSRELVLTSILYAIYVPLAVIGLRSWMARYRARECVVVSSKLSC